MLGSMTSGVTAMAAFVKNIEVVGNNISNINTVGFKGSTVRYADTFSNTLKRGTASTTSTGSNSTTQQIGTGTKISTIKTQFTQGSLETTNITTDCGISGEGFFRVRDSVTGEEYVTRAGDFRIDDDGYLVTNDGYRVQGLGLYADETDTDGDGVYEDAFSASSAIDYTSLQDIRIDYRGDDDGIEMESYEIDTSGQVIAYLSDGTSMVRGQILLQQFRDPGALVKTGDNLYTSMADAGPTQDWPASRTAGVVSTSFTNADDYELFTAGGSGNGTIVSGSLEISNVDLTEEFSNMITVQRSFQAASKLITTSDEILQDIVNLKR